MSAVTDNRSTRGADHAAVTAWAQHVANERNRETRRIVEQHPELHLGALLLMYPSTAASVIGELSTATAAVCVHCLGSIEPREPVWLERSRRGVMHLRCCDYSPTRRIHCGNCERKILTDAPGHLAYCCDACREEARRVRRRGHRRPITCAECGDQFTPARSDAATCSDRCRQRRRRGGML